MPDIVANLLHLSSEVAEVAELLEPAARHRHWRPRAAEAAAIVEAATPDWIVESLRGIAAASVPLDLAAEALESE